MIAADQIVANVSVAKLSCTYHFCVLLGNTVCQISLQFFLESYQRYFLQ